MKSNQEWIDEYAKLREENNMVTSISKLVDMVKTEFASQPPAMTAQMKELFMTWLTGTVELNDTKAKLIIEYVENYFASQPPAPVGKLWEDSCPFCEISPVMCKSCGETLPSPVTSLQRGYSEADIFKAIDRTFTVLGYGFAGREKITEQIIQSLNKK